MIVIIRNLTAGPVSLPGPMPRLNSDRNRQIEITPENYDKYRYTLDALRDSGFIDIILVEPVGSSPSEDKTDSFYFDPVKGHIYFAQALIAPITARFYQNSAIDPTLPAPSAGDVYFNTVLNMLMAYDASRLKWLSIASNVVHFGRSGNTAAGAFFRGVDTTFTSTSGYPGPHNGTVVAFAVTRTNVASATYQLMADSAVVYERPTTTIKDTVININANFAAASVLNVKNKTGGGNVQNALGWFQIKWRV